MNIVTIIVRILLGLMFLVFGSNAFLHFIPMPPMSGPSGNFLGSMNVTGYLMAVAAFQVVGGALLLIGRFAPLGLTLLGPVIVNIVFFHVFMDRTGLGMAAIVALLSLFLLWRYWASFACIVRPQSVL